MGVGVGFLGADSRETPFADRGRGVAGGLEDLGEGGLLKRQELGPGRQEQLRIVGQGAGNPVGDVQAGGIFSGEERGARGRADGAGGVILGELHAVARELVDGGRFVDVAAEAGEIRSAEVVGENEDDVGFYRCGAVGERNEKGTGQETEVGGKETGDGAGVHRRGRQKGAIRVMHGDGTAEWLRRCAPALARTTTGKTHRVFRAHVGARKRHASRRRTRTRSRPSRPLKETSGT